MKENDCEGIMRTIGYHGLLPHFEVPLIRAIAEKKTATAA